MTRPIIVVPCCTKRINDYTFDAVKREYTSAVAQAADCQPLLLPLDSALVDIEAVLGVADGLLFTGSPSNIDPRHYSERQQPVLPHALDPQRDAVTLPLIRDAIARKIPTLAICRGFQELNVALGGTLYQSVHTEGPYFDHRENKDAPIAERWGPKHPVKLSGRLREWIGRDEIIVNSLHGQGIARLADGLIAEAHAEDGLIEAVRGPHDDSFCLGVQWHPEWDATTNTASKTIFQRFADAVRSRRT